MMHNVKEQRRIGWMAMLLVGLTAACGALSSGPDKSAEEPPGALGQQRRAVGVPRDCADIKAETPGAPSGVYSVQPPGSAAAFSVYCDMTTDGGGWTLVYKVSRGVNADVNALWKGSATLNESNAGMLNTNIAAAHYMNRYATSLWNQNGYNVGEVRVGVYTGGVEQTYLQFDSRKVDRFSWYNQGRVIKSRYTDVFTSGMNFFSIDGDFSIGRTWFVSQSYNGCAADVGWLAVLNTNSAGAGCSWESHAGVGIRYSTATTAQNWTAGAMANGDVMAIFVRPGTPLAADCSELKIQNPNLPSGVYTILPIASTSSIPVYCDMSTDGGGWTMVYKVSKNVGGDIYGLWNGSTTLNEGNVTMLHTSASGAQYVNRFVTGGLWNGKGYTLDQVRVAVFTGGVEKKGVRFDARNTDKSNWFTRARVQKSPWTDLLTAAANVFSIAGDSGERRWFMNSAYPGCANDTGWMIVSNRPDMAGCAWENYGPKPVIIYSNAATLTNWNAVTALQADVYAVFVRNLSTFDRATEASQGAANFTMKDANSWIPANGCGACHRAGSVLAGQALALHNGLSVNNSSSNGAAWLAQYIVNEQQADGGWTHSGTYRFAKTAFDMFGLAAYVDSGANSSYITNLKRSADWIWSQVNNGPYTTNCNGAFQYRSGNHTVTFPADGKLFASQVRFFVPQDLCNTPVTADFYTTTSQVVFALGILRQSPALVAADVTKYTNLMNSLTDMFEGTYVRTTSQGGSNAAWGTQQLSSALVAMISAGRGPAVNARAAAMRDELLSLATYTGGWGDRQFNYCENAYSTGEALFALYLAGVRLDQSPQIQAGMDFLYRRQNPDGSWSPTCGAATTYDVPTTYAEIALSSYGQLNVDFTLSNVTPPDASNPGAARIDPGLATTQTVTFKVNIKNTGYVTNSFRLSPSGGIAGTNITIVPDTLTIGQNASGTADVTAVFPANLPAGTQALSVVASYTGANGLIYNTRTVAVNVGAAPGAGALATSTVFTAGGNATVTAGNNLTLTVQVRDPGNANLNVGSVTFYAGGQSIGTVSPVSSSYSLLWSVPQNVAGAQTITATFGGLGAPANPQYLTSTVTTTVTVNPVAAPPKPTITSPVDGAQLSNIPIAITGTSQTNTVVTIKDNGLNVGSAITANDGTFSFTILLTVGSHTFTAVASNAGGNSPPSDGVRVGVNPGLPDISSPVNGYISSNGQIPLVGTGIPGAAIVVLENGSVMGAVPVGADGRFNGNITLQPGPHSLTIVQNLGGQDSYSLPRSVAVLPNAPTITSPAAGANIATGSGNVTGTSQAGVTVTVYDNGVAIGSGTADANGSYSITVNLAFGARTLTAKASNSVGTSAASTGVSVTVPVWVPVISAPTNNAHVVNPTVVTGTAVPAASVEIWDNGALSQTVTANGQGQFTATLTLTTGSHVLKARQTFAAQTSAFTANLVVTAHFDTDGDGDYDEADNCVSYFNPDQVDRDGDLIGDVCDKAPQNADGTNTTVNVDDTSNTVQLGDDTHTNKNPIYPENSRINNAFLPNSAVATRETLTLVKATVANPLPNQNIRIIGKATQSEVNYTTYAAYEAQLGATHGRVLPGGLPATVKVNAGRTTAVTNAFRLKTLTVEVKEQNGTWTRIPNCNTGKLAAPDNRCSRASLGYITTEGTTVVTGYVVEVEMFSM